MDTVKVINEVELNRPLSFEAGVTSDIKFAIEWMDFLKSASSKVIVDVFLFAASGLLIHACLNIFFDINTMCFNQYDYCNGLRYFYIKMVVSS